MDNLCHTLMGAALGEAGLKNKTRFGNAALMIAANLPDIDVLVFATSMPSVAFRRGWTHGPIAQVVLPVAVTGMVLLWARRARVPEADSPPLSPKWLFILALVGVLSHVGLDLLNPYGLRLLAPFSWRWFYGDTLFIIDPWLWMILALGIWTARRQHLPLTARHALTVAALYLAAMTMNARFSRTSILQEWQSTRGGPPASLMVGPAPITPFRKQVIVDDGLEYTTGTLRLMPRNMVWDARRVPKNDRHPRVDLARRDPRIQGFLVWARFPYWTFDQVEGGTRVTVSDMRMPARGGTFSESVVISDAIHETGGAESPR